MVFGAILFPAMRGMAVEHPRRRTNSGLRTEAAHQGPPRRARAFIADMLSPMPSSTESRIFEGDIILDHVQDLAPGQPLPNKAAPASVGVAYAQYFWPKDSLGVAEIPYIAFLTSGATNLGAALRAMRRGLSPALYPVRSADHAGRLPLTSISTQPITAPRAISAVGRAGGEQVTGRLDRLQSRDAPARAAAILRAYITSIRVRIATTS